MVSSWTEFFSGCKSRLSVIARSCFLQRVHWFEKYQEAKQTQEELRKVKADCEVRCRQLEQEKEDLCERVSELQAQLAQPRAIQLPFGDVPPGLQYGDNLIALCVNLGRRLGVRPAESALEIFFTGWERRRKSRRTKPFAGGCKESA